MTTSLPDATLMTAGVLESKKPNFAVCGVAATLTAVAASIFMFPAGGDRLREIQREQRLRRYFFRPFAPMLCQLPARSNASAARYSVDSCQCLATSISPIGRSPSPNPHGID